MSVWTARRGVSESVLDLNRVEMLFSIAAALGRGGVVFTDFAVLN